MKGASTAPFIYRRTPQIGAIKIQGSNTTRNFEYLTFEQIGSSTNPIHFSLITLMAITAMSELFSPLHLPQRVRWFFMFRMNGMQRAHGCARAAMFRMNTLEITTPSQKKTKLCA
jgi:hypothetical protein